MPNLITRYDNGTFEDVLANWDALFSSGYGAPGRAERSADFAYQGAFSCKFTTIAMDKDAIGSSGSVSPMYFFYPATYNDTYEIRLRIRCSAGIPDDLVFALIPNNGGITDSVGILKVVTAAQCKAGWQEIRANFKAETFPDGADMVTAVPLTVIYNTDKFLSFHNTIADRFPDVENFFAYNNIPEGEFIYVDFAEAEQKAIPVEPDGQFVGRRLYYVENIFMLSIDGELYEIAEPIRWDNIRISVMWDNTTFGYKFEFTDKDVLLEFDASAGFELLQQIWKDSGTKGVAGLKFGERTGDTIEILFEMEANFQSYKETEFVIKMNFERLSFADKLRNRFDLPTDLFSGATLAGILLEPMLLKQLYLHPRLLPKVADLVYNTNVDAEQVMTLVADGDDYYYSAIVPLKIVKSNVAELTAPMPDSDGSLLYSGFTLPPGITSRVINIRELTVSFQYTKTNSTQQVQSGFKVFMLRNITSSSVNPSAGQSAESVGHLQFDGIIGSTEVVDATVNGILEMPADAALFIHAFVRVPVNGSFTTISDFQWVNLPQIKLDIQEQSVAAPSVASGPLIFEALNRQLEIILDVRNPLKSNFFGRTDLGYAVDGPGSKHFILNGLLVRNFEDKPFNLSAKGWFNSLSALFCMGMSVERDNENNEYVRFEPLEYFFKNVLLMRLNVISKYEKSSNDDYTFSKLRFGFQKYPRDNQADSLQDFHTDFIHLTPLDRIDSKMEKVVDSILSGYYIEYTRQEAFRENPTNAYETDNDTFVISGREGAALEDVDIVFDQDNRRITIIGDEIFEIVAGDTLVITSATGGVTNGNYVAAAVSIPFAYDRVHIDVTEALPSDGAGTGDVSLSVAGRFRAKRLEDFTLVEGVVFEKSVYNLEHHTKRIFERWSKAFQAGWDFLVNNSTASDGVQFIEGKNNINVGTRKAGETVTAYDRNFERIDGGRLLKPLFGHSKMEFEAPLTWTTLNLIRKAYENRHPDGKNFGYFQWYNPDGVIESGWPLELKFDPVKQICKFTMIEKFNG